MIRMNKTLLFLPNDIDYTLNTKIVLFRQLTIICLLILTPCLTEFKFKEQRSQLCEMSMP